MALRKGENTGILKRQNYVSLYGELALKGAVDVSKVRLRVTVRRCKVRPHVSAKQSFL
jgi:hypothetical protein